MPGKAPSSAEKTDLLLEYVREWWRRHGEDPDRLFRVDFWHELDDMRLRLRKENFKKAKLKAALRYHKGRLPPGGAEYILGEPDNESQAEIWARERWIEVLEAELASRDPAPAALQEPSMLQEPSTLNPRPIGFQPPPRGWQDIEIIFLSDERVQVCSDHKQETYNYTEFGFEDKRNGKPNSAWVLLREMAQKSGIIQRPNPGKEKSKIQKSIEEIRKRLKAHFKIDTDPVPFNGTTYKASFKIRCGESFGS